MKNIHVLPTDKPSRLFKNTDDDLSLDDELQPNGVMCQNQNIYITSDEEIEEKRCWVINSMDKIESVPHSKWGKLIILTTDQDLIKDGVQVIDDEFLEWFVKNPSCEEVEVYKDERLEFEQDFHFYEIIIPKETPFKHECEVLSKEYIMENRSNAYEFIDFDKQETPEEETLAKIKFVLLANNDAQAIRLLEQYGGWMQEQNKNKYSEEEVIDILESLVEHPTKPGYKRRDILKFIEQFKKK